MTRGEVEKLIAAHGWKTTSSVSRNTDYLVSGTSPGSKLAKATELGIPVLSESDLKNMIS